MLACNFRPDRYDELLSLHRATLAGLRQGDPVVVADNVADYVNNSFKGSRTSIVDIFSYPPCPPAFEACFIEWNEPAIRYPDGATIAERGGVKQKGFFLYSIDDKAEIDRSFRAAGNPPDFVISKTRWLLLGLLYASDARGITFPVCFLSVCLDEQGKFIPRSSRKKVYLAKRCVPDEAELGSHWAEIMTTLAFMQCKNVQRIDVTASEGPTPKWCRRQRVPELKYHALQIDPNISTRPHSGDRKTEGDRSGKALHICRGHFAHFIDDGVSMGLFGRHHFGTFWIPAHTRGTLEHGRVVSTYNVTTPQPCNV